MTNLNLTAPINSLGYGQVGLNLLKVLVSKTNVALWELGRIEWELADIAEISGIIREAKEKALLYDKGTPSLRLWHQFDLAQHVSSPRWAFVIFEQDKLRPHEIHHLNNQDLIFVCSKWAANILLENKVTTPYIIAPLGVDSSIFNPHVRVNRLFYGLKESDCVFLNMGKWEIRKGHDFLLEVFQEAFPPSIKDVKLIMHTYNPCLQQEDNTEWEKMYQRDKRILLSNGRFNSNKQVAELMSMADCGVFPSRAEGWNLELTEMLAMHKHVIATDFSAHAEFCAADDVHLIEVDEMESAYDGKWFFGEGKWAKATVAFRQQLKKKMQNIYDMKSSGTSMTNLNLIPEKFTWQNCAQQIIDQIS